MSDFINSYDETECLAELSGLFPQGPCGPDVRAELAGEECDVLDLVGKGLWEIFSDSHDVIAPDGRVLHLGSFRYSAEVIADWLNDGLGRRQYDYINFYLGSYWLGESTDMTPVYEMIFRRLKNSELDWIYHFPEIGLVDFRPLREALDAEAQAFHYDPEESWAKQEGTKQHDEEIARMRERLDEGNREAKEAAVRDRRRKSCSLTRTFSVDSPKAGHPYDPLRASGSRRSACLAPCPPCKLMSASASRDPHGGRLMAKSEIETIRSAVVDQRYTLTEHAYDEMAEDNLDVLDVESALLTGKLDQALTADPRGTRYVIIGHATDLATRVGVVVRFVEHDQLLVITVYEIK